MNLDHLDALLREATPGVWKLWGMQVVADQDGTSDADTAVPVADTLYLDEDGRPRTNDANLIAELHNAAPDLIVAARDLAATNDTVTRLAGQLDAARAETAALHRECDALNAWKSDALTVLAGLDELGQALELPLGEQITAARALGAVNALRGSRDAAQRMAAALAGGSDES